MPPDIYKRIAGVPSLAPGRLAWRTWRRLAVTDAGAVTVAPAAIETYSSPDTETQQMLGGERDEDG